MTTERKIVANRRNAARSTGPRTAEGKAVVALNALKHGALSVMPIIPHVEDAAAWETHREGVLVGLNPVGVLESRLAERVASLLWRMQRVERFESAAVLAALAGLEMPPAPREANILDDDGDGDHPDLERLHAREKWLDECDKRLALVRQSLGLIRALETGATDVPAAEPSVNKVLSTATDVLEDWAHMADPPGPHDPEPLCKLMGLPAGTEYDRLDWTVRLVRSALTAMAAATKKTEWSAERLVKEVGEYLEQDVAEDRAARKSKMSEASVLRARVEIRDAQTRAQRLLPDDAAAARVQRYEAHLTRQLTQTLDELERLQTRRVASAVSVAHAAGITG